MDFKEFIGISYMGSETAVGADLSRLPLSAPGSGAADLSAIGAWCSILVIL